MSFTQTKRWFSYSFCTMSTRSKVGKVSHVTQFMELRTFKTPDFIRKRLHHGFRFLLLLLSLLLLLRSHRPLLCDWVPRKQTRSRSR